MARGEWFVGSKGCERGGSCGKGDDNLGKSVCGVGPSVTFDDDGRAKEQSIWTASVYDEAISRHKNSSVSRTC